MRVRVFVLVLVLVLVFVLALVLTRIAREGRSPSALTLWASLGIFGITVVGVVWWHPIQWHHGHGHGRSPSALASLGIGVMVGKL